MDGIKVEKGVPLPDGIKPGRPKKYPFQEMKVGDSILVKNEDKDSAIRSGYAFFERQLISASFKTKKLNNGETRIWRVA